MRILGIDPGLATVGWAVVEYKDGNPVPLDYGAILTDKDLKTEDRLSEIYEDMNHIIDEFKPDECGMETLLFYNNITSGIAVGEARGVIMLAINNANIPIHDFTPLQIKSSITGYGNAKKRQVQENVKMICNLDSIIQPDDAADAVAVAIACYDRLRMDQISI